MIEKTAKHQRISKKLNLVIPVTRDEDGVEMYVHSSPITADTFDTYFLPIAKTFSAIYSHGLGPIGGPRVADKMLRRVAVDMKEWDGLGGVQQGLVAEMHRLTVVLAPGERGWEMIPYDEAVKRVILSTADAAEIEAAITFFMLASAMHRHADLLEILGGAMRLWSARIESSTSTELITFLQTQTAAESTGVRREG